MGHALDERFLQAKIMNKKEARKIVDLWNKVPPKDSIERDARWVSVNQSIGYLECYEKAKGLEESLLHEMGCVECGEGSHEGCGDCHSREALAKWEKEK